MGVEEGIASSKSLTDSSTADILTLTSSTDYGCFGRSENCSNPLPILLPESSS